MHASKSCQRCESPFMSPGVRCIPCSTKTFSTCTACKVIFADNGATDKICSKCNRAITKAAQQAAKRATTAALKAAAHTTEPPPAQQKGQKCTACNIGFAPPDQLCAYCQGQMPGYEIFTCPTCTQRSWSPNGTCRHCAQAPTPQAPAQPNRTCMRCSTGFYTNAGSRVCHNCVTKEKCTSCLSSFKCYHIDNRGLLCPKCWRAANTDATTQ